jgi:hypothetical protein
MQIFTLACKSQLAKLSRKVCADTRLIILLVLTTFLTKCLGSHIIGNQSGIILIIDMTVEILVE